MTRSAAHEVETLDALTAWLASLHLAHRAEYASLWTRAPGDELHLSVRVPRDDGSMPGRLPLQGHPLGWVACQGLSLRAPLTHVLDGPAPGWIVAAPVGLPGREPVGCVTLELQREPGRSLTPWLELAAQVAARLILDAETLEVARRDRLKCRALHAAIEILGRRTGLIGLADQLAVGGREIADARGALVTSWDSERSRGTVLATAGSIPSAAVGGPIRRSDSFLGLALAHGVALPADGLPGNGRRSVYGPEVASDAGSVILAPISSGEEVVGGLAVEHAMGRSFSPSDLGRVLTLVCCIGPALRDALQIDRARPRSWGGSAVRKRPASPRTSIRRPAPYFIQDPRNGGEQASTGLVEVGVACRGRLAPRKTTG